MAPCTVRNAAPAPTETRENSDPGSKGGGSRQTRRALLIGIGYGEAKEWPELYGTFDDVERFRALLRDTYGYREDEITVLMDDTRVPKQRWPTEANILREMQRLVADAAPGDQLVLLYSGHSDQQPTDGDLGEEDGSDEVIISCDEKRIVDNDLRRILVNPLPAHCNFTAIFDSCHSGTLLDLPHYHCNQVWVPWLSKGKRRTKTMQYQIVRRLAQLNPSNACKLPPQASLAPRNLTAPAAAPTPSARALSLSLSQAQAKLSLTHAQVRAQAQAQAQAQVQAQSPSLLSLVELTIDTRPFSSLSLSPSSSSSPSLSRKNKGKGRTGTGNTGPPSTGNTGPPSTGNTHRAGSLGRPSAGAGASRVLWDWDAGAGALVASPVQCDSPQSQFVCDGWCRPPAPPVVGEGRPHVVSVSSCADMQRSWEGGAGTMTTILCNFLSEHPEPTYRELMTHINFSLHDTARQLHQWTRKAKKDSRLNSPPASAKCILPDAGAANTGAGGDSGVQGGVQSKEGDKEQEQGQQVEEPEQIDEIDGEMSNFQTPELSSLFKLNMDDIFRL
ncbi:hypothetical protein DENSPDRAFT_615649 [Dentipellis sp. KUC8613]|nr:hypothetical protein DENSPDRAFT_615649 [Dentipellis sp. KUC8613]